MTVQSPCDGVITDVKTCVSVILRYWYNSQRRRDFSSLPICQDRDDDSVTMREWLLPVLIPVFL